jgi:hypothetical protein
MRVGWLCHLHRGPAQREERRLFAMFIARGWKNGRNSAKPTLGLAISIADRDRYFRRRWEAVAVHLPGRRGVTIVELNPSFWRSCPELRSPEIGRWLRGTGVFPWPHGSPPRYNVAVEGDGEITVQGRV